VGIWELDRGQTRTPAASGADGTASAVEHLEAMLSVTGVDMVPFPPAD